MCIGHLRFLIVDNAEDTRNLLQMALEQKGYEVHTAEDGKEALDVVDSAMKMDEHFDIIILDYAMPSMSGLEAAIKIRERGLTDCNEKPVRIDYLTGYDYLDISTALKKKLNINKTWRKTELVEFVKSL